MTQLTKAFVSRALVLFFALPAWLASGTVVGGQALGASPTEFPSKPLRWLVPTGPSGGNDTIARMFGQRVSELLGQPIIIDNRGGAAGKIGLDTARRASADGYSVTVISITQLLSTSLSRTSDIDLTKDFAPVSLMASVPLAMAIPPSVNATTMKQFIALAKSQPGKMNYGSGGIGAVHHVATELLKREAGIDLVHVPYKGSAAALVDVLAGRLQFFMTNASNVIPHAKSGKLRVLGVSSVKRLPEVPDVPTFSELGLAGASVDVWYGMLAPRGTPKNITAKLSNAIAAVGKMPVVRHQMASGGADPVGSTPEEFGAFLKSEATKWSKVAKHSGISISD